MSIFNFSDGDALGRVITVDTASVVIRVDKIDRLKKLQVNRLTALHSSKPGQYHIGIVSKITRRLDTSQDDKKENVYDGDKEIVDEINLVTVILIGTLHTLGQDKGGNFYRTLQTVPEINANCFCLEGDDLTHFMGAISNIEESAHKLSLGKFALGDNADAYLNGNKLFQRHALIVGSTGTGKSWATARLLDQVSQLRQANVVLFDIHGEYGPLVGEGYRHYRIAGPSDINTGDSLDKGVLHLPYWMLGYEAMLSMFVSRSDQNAPNQTMLMTQAIVDAKKKKLEQSSEQDILSNFTIDSPVPFNLDDVLGVLKEENTKRVPAARKDQTKEGPNYGKLTRLISRLEAKISDRRLAFLFNAPDPCFDMSWFPKMVREISAGRGSQHDSRGGIKIIDFSEVPSDILPLMVSVLAQVIFSTSLWTKVDDRHPIAIMCDEAHLYIPERMTEGSSDAVAVNIFERIAKEGRKYGVGLVVISQRPSEVNRTVLSQCNNVIAMRLTNGDDQNVIRRLLPDSLGGFGDLLPILDIGEAIVFGDASLLPMRLRVSKPEMTPDGQTVEFWNRWNEEEPKTGVEDAVRSWRRQSLK